MTDLDDSTPSDDETAAKAARAMYRCENCGDRDAVAERTAVVNVPELGEKRVKALALCRPCTDAFDWGSGDGPTARTFGRDRPLRTGTDHSEVQET